MRDAIVARALTPAERIDPVHRCTPYAISRDEGQAIAAAHTAEIDRRIREYRRRADEVLGADRPECRDVVEIAGDCVRVYRRKGRWYWSDLDRTIRRYCPSHSTTVNLHGGPFPTREEATEDARRVIESQSPQH